MKLIYSITSFIIIILFMFASLLLAFYSFGFAFTPSNLLPNMLGNFYQKWQYGILFTLFFIAGTWVLYPFFANREKKTTSINQTELGMVDITLDAVDKLVKGVAMQQEGVNEIETHLKTSEKGLHIHLSGKVEPDIPIPNLTKDLQLIVKSYIEDTTGVTVEEVRVLVKSISDRS